MARCSWGTRAQFEVVRAETWIHRNSQNDNRSTGAASRNHHLSAVFEAEGNGVTDHRAGPSPPPKKKKKFAGRPSGRP